MDDLKANAGRFTGMAEVYDGARPSSPDFVLGLARRYLGREPEHVVDLGCGTGLSTRVWAAAARHVTGIEPNTEMLSVAREKCTGCPNIEFMQRFAHETGLPDGCADVVSCSQSFHWMEPVSTLAEANRILKSGGLFMAYDCDWPPVCNARAEEAYKKLFDTVAEAESIADRKAGIKKWDKENHLANIQNSGYFHYVREIVFANKETCDEKRFIGLALSQGGLQAIVRETSEDIAPALKEFEASVREAFGDKQPEILFCYRLRLGIKK